MNWYKKAQIKYPNQHEGSTVFFTDGLRVLLLKRSSETYNGMWCLPGGHAESGESDRETAEREVVEEIGTIMGYNYNSHTRNGWATFFYKVDKPFDCKLNQEHSKYVWADLDEFKNYDLVPHLKRHAQKYYRMAKKQPY